MKKVLLPLIAAAAVSFGASAQTMPTNVFNYQGVCAEKGAQIEVGFDVVAENGDVVYSQKGYETTNANGAFTTTIGGHDGWDAIDWAAGKYQVVTYINKKEVSKADLNAVPYALVAESVVGLDNIYNDINDLAMANRMNATDIAEIKELNLPNVLDNLEMLVPQIEALHESVATVEEGLDTTQGDVIDLTEGFQSLTAQVMGLSVGEADTEWVSKQFETLSKDLEATTNLAQSLSEDLYKEGGLVDHIVALDELNLPNVVDNLEMLVPQIETLHEATAKNAEDIKVLFDELEGKAKQVELVATQTKVAEVEEAVEANTANIAALGKFQESFNDEYMVPIQEALDSITADLAATTNLAQSLSYDLYNEETGIVEIVANLYELNLPSVVENLEMLVPQIEDMHENIASLQDAIDQVSYFINGDDSEFASVSSLATQNSKNIADIQATLDEVAYMLTEEDGEFAQISSLATQNSKNITDLQAVTEKNADDIAVAFEELDGKAKQVEMVAVQNEVSNLTNQLDMHMEVIQALIEAVAELGVEIDLGSLVEPMK